MRQLVKKNLTIPMLYVTVVLAWIILSVSFENFGSKEQLRYILQQAAFLGVAAAGQNLIILTGGIDLSSGYMISLESVLVSMFLTKMQYPFVLAVVLSIVITALFGVLNGCGVSFLKIPPMVMTLATGTLVQGVELLITNGFPSSINHKAFKNWISLPSVFGLTNTVIVWFVVIIVVVFFLTSTTLGRKIYFYERNF